MLFLHKMPKIWIEYTRFLEKQKKVTLTRKTYDRALTSLPVTQHDKIWPFYVKWALSGPFTSTTNHVLTRYCKIDPSFLILQA